MSYKAIICETTAIRILHADETGIRFLTESPGELDPVLMFLKWEHVRHLNIHLPPPQTN